MTSRRNGETTTNGRPIDLQPSELRRFLQGLRVDILKDVDDRLFRAIDGLVMELEHRQTKPKNGFAEKPKQRRFLLQNLIESHLIRKHKILLLDFLQAMESLPASPPRVKSSINRSSPFRSESQPAELPPKEFVCRNSTLTDLWEVTHLRSVYNICLSILFLIYVNITIFYFIDSNKLKEDLSVIQWTFSKFHIVTATWIGMMSATLFVMYPVFRFWATTRPISTKIGFYDYMFFWFFFVYQMALLIVPAKVIISYNMPMVSSFIILAEQSRLMMKTHAFARENATRALRYKAHEDDEKNAKPYPEVEKLIYFLFAPTLVYRDSYPRTPSIRWRYVAWNFLQVLGCILGGYIPVTLFIVDTFKEMGRQQIPLVNFMFILAASVFAGGLLMFLVFYGMFHCWLNAFGEMLRFGDRMFYHDWWNCTSFAKFYRSWNMVVYDWLYSYIYRDMYTVLGRNRVSAMLVVFFVSAIIHEYILAVCFKFVFPLLFLLFSSFGILLVFITRRKTSAVWNVFLWIAMFQGWGLLTVFYSMEWYARINCPRTMDSWLDYVVPRSFTCNIITLPS